ncbi:MAG: DUF2461 family protein [Candidatus Saccharimonadales bacterium]
MFKGFSPKTIDFMCNLSLNNEKPWFEAHKSDFQQDFQTPMRELGQDVFKKVTDKCGSQDFIHKLSRVYRDARRLRAGDGPYRSNLWFSIEKPSDEWTSTPVFWFELHPENWSYGMGYYRAKSETMAKFRTRLDKDPKKFEKLIAPLAKQSEFILTGDEYVRKKEAPTPKTAAWYNKKSFSLIHEQPNGSEIFSPDLADRIANGMISLMPLYDYFISLDSDPSPEI